MKRRLLDRHQDAEGERNGDQKRGHDPAAITDRHLPLAPSVDEVAGHDGQQIAEHEGRIGRAAEQADAGKRLEDAPEQRGVAAERVQQHPRSHEGEEADLPSPQGAAKKSRGHQDGDREGAKIELAHVSGEEQVDRSPQGARWAPMVLQRTGGAEQVRHQGGEKMRRMKGAAAGARIIDRRSIRLVRQEQGQRHREHDHREAADGRKRQGPEACTKGGPSAGRVQPMPENEPDHDPQAKIGNLIPSRRHEPGYDTGHEPIHQRAPPERPRQQPEDDRQVGETENLADMLETPGSRSAEPEGEGGDESASRMPSLVAKEQQDRQPSETEHAENDRVGGAKAGIGIEQHQAQKGRREDQRLRIGDLRRA